MNYKNKIIAGILIITAGIFLLFKPAFSNIDNFSKNFIDKNIKNTLISYAIIRGINAGVSVIKHSELEMQPAGVGVSVGAGEVLDPIDDLTERVSNLLFISVIVYGALEVLFKTSIILFYYFFPFALIVLAFSIFYKKKKLLKIGYFILIISLIRFFFVFLAFGGEITDNYFQNEINKTENKLKIFSTYKTEGFSMPKTSDGLFNAFKNKFEYVQNEAGKIKDKFLLFLDNASDIVNNLIKLAYLYFGMFVTEIIFIPLLLYFLFRKIMKVLYES